MPTYILNKYEAAKFNADPSKYNVMIRVTSPEDSFLELQNESAYNDIMTLKFYDFTEEQNGLTVFNEIHFEAIMNFFEKHKMCENMIIHCDQGMSRSAGIAVGWFLFKDERASIYKLYHSGRHMPNRLVVKTFCMKLGKDMKLINKWEKEKLDFFKKSVN